MELKVGDRVAYGVQFLASIGESHGDMSHAKGVVKKVKSYGREPNISQIAEIQWDAGAELPAKVNTANLAIVGPNTRFCNCG